MPSCSRVCKPWQTAKANVCETQPCQHLAPTPLAPRVRIATSLGGTTAAKILDVPPKDQ